MPTKKQKKGVDNPALEEVAIALALAQALGTPHDEESYKLTIQRKECDPWSYKLQHMRITPQKQYYI